MNIKIIVESLSIDLKRVALGLNKGSFKMAAVFKQEAKARSLELEKEKMDKYLKFLVDSSNKVLESESERTAEDALMYSTLFQNVSKRL